jgi:hypothetical protein
VNRLLNAVLVVSLLAALACGGMAYYEWRESRPRYSIERTHIVLENIPTCLAANMAFWIFGCSFGTC